MERVRKCLIKETSLNGALTNDQEKDSGQKGVERLKCRVNGTTEARKVGVRGDTKYFLKIKDRRGLTYIFA